MDRNSDSEDIIRRITQRQRQLYSYIFSLVLNADDAQEVLQETNLTLWRKQDEIPDVANFPAWACRVAYYEVLAFRKRAARDKLVFSFDDELLARLAGEAEGSLWQDSRAAQLQACLRALSNPSRELLQLRYAASLSIDEVGRKTGRSVAAVSQALYRIRKRLLDCITRKVISEAAP
ncbi:MAG: sigma-70 family RNA polymerase sigma factor [Pirellulaceae bacterium]